ncbi:hypothetical protein [Shimwellia blattae]|uniref:hypothetical protein n=1 Tax=Shimwellia blattae TaxID=563 RepID=UPI000F6CC1AF|nr:hypothetical protein [Shimwellia blattae]VDY63099.1 Uncharacterised protein [Shimwellia blattae]
MGINGNINIPLTIRKIEKRILIFFSAFLMLLILSLMKGFFADIHYQYFSALKSKYVISIVRFIELILCLIVTLTPYNIVRNNKGSVESIIKVFLTFNLYITLFIFILFVSDVLFHTGLVSYGVTHRLRGLYVEGGPYGLFISTLILLELTFFKRKLVIFVFFVGADVITVKSRDYFVFSISDLLYFH